MKYKELFGNIWVIHTAQKSFVKIDLLKAHANSVALPAIPRKRGRNGKAD